MDRLPVWWGSEGEVKEEGGLIVRMPGVEYLK
jgi:hypothetical protein